MKAVLAPMAALLATTAAAQELQGWGTVQAIGPVDGRLLLWAELQGRMTSDISRLGQVIARGALGVRLPRDVDLYAGYQFEHSNLTPGVTRDEHRFWQQILVPVVRQPDGFVLVTRWRLEERRIVGAEDLGWRLRVQWRAHQPLGGRGRAGPLAWSETFFALNSTDWGAQAGLDQQRSFIGWLQPVAPRLTVEAGYMNRYLNRPGRNPVQHVISLTLNRRLGP